MRNNENNNSKTQLQFLTGALVGAILGNIAVHNAAEQGKIDLNKDLNGTTLYTKMPLAVCSGLLAVLLCKRLARANDGMVAREE